MRNILGNFTYGRSLALTEQSPRGYSEPPAMRGLGRVEPLYWAAFLCHHSLPSYHETQTNPSVISVVDATDCCLLSDQVTCRHGTAFPLLRQHEQQVEAATN